MGRGAGGALQAPTALSLVVSLTCEAPPRDPNQCELVDRPRYRKGPHICFDYNATVRGEQSWGWALGRDGARESSAGTSRAMAGSPGENLGSGVPLSRGVEPWGDPRGAELRGNGKVSVPWGEQNHGVSPKGNRAMRGSPGVQCCGGTPLMGFRSPGRIGRRGQEPWSIPWEIRAVSSARECPAGG